MKQWNVQRYWLCCDRKSRAAWAQSFALWQQATIEFTCHDHSIIACSRHIYLWCCSSRTSRSWWITHLTQHHRRGCNNCLPSPPYHWSCMFDQLLMWHNAAYSVHYAQRQVNASLWNARAYSRRSSYIKMYANITLLLTWRLQSWHKGR